MHKCYSSSHHVFSLWAFMEQDVSMRGSNKSSTPSLGADKGALDEWKRLLCVHHTHNFVNREEQNRESWFFLRAPSQFDARVLHCPLYFTAFHPPSKTLKQMKWLFGPSFPWKWKWDIIIWCVCCVCIYACIPWISPTLIEPHGVTFLP